MFTKNLFTGEVTVTNHTLPRHFQRKLEIEGVVEMLLECGRAEMPLGALVGEWALINWRRPENDFFYALHGDHEAEPPRVTRKDVAAGTRDGHLIVFRLWQEDLLVGTRYANLHYPGCWSAAGRGHGHILTTIALEVITVAQVWINGHFRIRNTLSPGSATRWEKEGLLDAETSADILRAFGWPEEDCRIEDKEE